MGDDLFRNATAADVDTINKMLFDEYGPDYPYPMTVSSFGGEDISLLCERNGQPIAFARAARCGTAYELGRLIIRPEFRGNGLARELTTRRIELVRQRDQDTVFSEPVCNREDRASQRNLMDFGFVQTGLQFCKYPGILESKLGCQPESVTFASRRLDGSLDGRRPIFAPDDYREPLESVLRRSLTGTVAAFEDGMPEPVHHAPIQVRGSAGSEFLDIPANWAGTRPQVERARSRGFVLCGILLGMGCRPDGRLYDLLRLQRLPAGFRPNLALVHVTDELEPLRGHIQRELIA